MSRTNQPADHLGNIDMEPRRLPSTLNVLTILTFIGCGIGVLSSIYSFFTAQKGYDLAKENQEKMVAGQELAKKLLGGDPVEFARKGLENRLPILLIALVGYVLCSYGAIVMRDLKKQGFYLYFIGEILPLFSILFFIGAGMFGGVSGIFAIIIAVVFIILYATQLKFMKQ